VKANIYLIPTTLGGDNMDAVLPLDVQQIVNRIDYYIVENERTARRFLRKLGIKKVLRDLHFSVLDKRTKPSAIAGFLAPALAGKHIGVISEAGCPAVADPGSEVVRVAHEKRLRVVPLVGASSILMALMASGFNGQNFAFSGYLPIDKSAKLAEIRKLERKSHKEGQTQIFMETPFRNQALLDDLIQVCQSDTLLCIASNISLETEFIQTKTIAAWQKNKPNLHKQPTIFLL